MLELLEGQIMAGYVVMTMLVSAFMTGGLAADVPNFACSVPHCTTTNCTGNNCTGCESGYTLVNDAVWYGCNPHCLLCQGNYYFECSPGSDCNYCCDTDSCDVSCTVCPDSYYLGSGTPRMCYPSTPANACSVPHCTTITCTGNNCTGCESGYTLVNDAVWYGCNPHCLLCQGNYYFECSPGSDCNYCCDTDSCDVSCSECPGNYYLGSGTPRMCYPTQTNITTAEITTGATSTPTGGTQWTTISGATGTTHLIMETMVVMTIVLYLLLVPVDYSYRS